MKNHPENQVLALAIAGAALFAAGSASAVGDIDLAQAVDIARDAVPEGVALETEVDREDGFTAYEVDLVTPNGRTKWEVKIDPTTGEIYEIESESQDRDDRQEDAVKVEMLEDARLDFSDAQAIAIERYPLGEIREIELEIEHGRLYYEVKYWEEEDSRDDLELLVDAITGHVVVDGGSGDTDISMTEAVDIGQLAAGRGDVLEVEFERERGEREYEVEVVRRRGRVKSDVDLATVSGRVNSIDDSRVRRRDRRENRRILRRIGRIELTYDDALAIARDVQRTGRPTEIEIEIEHGRLFYKVKFRNRGEDDVEVFVDAITGEVF